MSTKFGDLAYDGYCPNGQQGGCQQGFTLIELLVAMVIFAMLALSGWQIMDSITRSRDRANVQLDELSELQYAYVQLSQDLAQVTDYVAVPPGLPDDATNLTSVFDRLTPTFTLSDTQISFTRLANPDPRLTPPPVLARVVYRVENGQLIKQRFYQANNPNETPTTSVLLTGIKEARWAALVAQTETIQPVSRFPDEQTRQVGQLSATVMANSPSSAPSPEAQGVDLTTLRQLPKGVQLSFSYHDQPMVWRFALPEAAPSFVSAAATPTTPASTPSLNTPASSRANSPTDQANPSSNSHAYGQDNVTGNDNTTPGDSPAATAIGGTPSRNARDD